MKIKAAILFIIVIIIISVTFILFKHEDIRMHLYLNDFKGNQGSYLTVWALSDLHIDGNQVHIFRNAVKDITDVFKKIDIALVAGDIIDNRNSEKYFRDYVNIKQDSRIKKWHEIAGNHDNYDIHNFRKYIRKPKYYSVELGNIIFLLLSDENGNNETFISNTAFRWWKNKVINNQDKIIITITHGFIEESRLGGKEVVDQIKKSQRFVDVLQKYKVDVWINGHLHVSHKYDNYRIQTIGELNYTNFLNVASIENRKKHIPSNSCVLLLKNNDDKILVLSRNHITKEFVDEGARFLFIRKKIKL